MPDDRIDARLWLEPADLGLTGDDLEGEAFSATMIELRHARGVRELRPVDPVNPGAMA